MINRNVYILVRVLSYVREKIQENRNYKSSTRVCDVYCIRVVDVSVFISQRTSLYGGNSNSRHGGGNNQAEPRGSQIEYSQKTRQECHEEDTRQNAVKNTRVPKAEHWYERLRELRFQSKSNCSLSGHQRTTGQSNHASFHGERTCRAQRVHEDYKRPTYLLVSHETRDSYHTVENLQSEVCDDTELLKLSEENDSNDVEHTSQLISWRLRVKEVTA